MRPPLRRWNLELCVQQSSHVDAWGNLDGEPLADSPVHCTSFAEALRTLRYWLIDFDGNGEEGDRIMAIVRAPDMPVAAWSTSSSSAALYWFATQLGHSWLHLPEVTRWSALRKSGQRPSSWVLDNEPPLLTVSL